MHFTESQVFILRLDYYYHFNKLIFFAFFVDTTYYISILLRLNVWPRCHSDLGVVGMHQWYK